MRITISQDTINAILDTEEPDYFHERGICYQSREQIPPLATGEECPQCGYRLAALPPYTRAAILAAAKRADAAAAKRADAAKRAAAQTDMPF